MFNIIRSKIKRKQYEIRIRFKAVKNLATFNAQILVKRVNILRNNVLDRRIYCYV